MFGKSKASYNENEINFKFKQIRAYSEMLISYNDQPELYNQIINKIEPVVDDLIVCAPSNIGTIQLEMIFRQKDRLLDTVEHRTTLWHLINQAAFNGLLELL